MNERIKQLVKQATTTYWTGLGERDEIDYEKLAELIVRACADAADGLHESYGAPKTTGKFLKTYFGVE
jgi:hypothetical protein